ncbi:hypothetical protein [Rhizobium tumorigenes]|uniref:hypothetical protein n=1 Tax=Rhizobium tumorigenes TaxID=2041385 RepID=UPI00241F7D14|nr:hypothetical protein [Rhizobium tumorigenes]WFS02769.1 hypothetical protein PR016_09280 [Rhizobium tumorigenes]
MRRYQAKLSSSTAAVVAAGSTQVVVKAADAFAVNDPVFMDWNTGAINNLNKITAATALTAVPATTYFTASDQAASVSSTNSSVVLSDGSVVQFMASNDSTGGPVYALWARKFSSKGVLLGKYYLGALNVSVMCSALLTNGNVVLIAGNGSSTGNFFIFNPSLRLIATASANAIPKHVQPTNNGGFIISHNAGLSFVSATGAMTSLGAWTASAPAISDEINGDGRLSDVGNCSGLTNYAPLPLSGGGFGYVLYNVSGVYYAPINADGTPIVAPVTLQAWSSQVASQVNVAISPTTGNIMWAANLSGVTGYYGITARNGNVVLASTSLAPIAAIASAQGLISLVSDANGNFVLVGSASGNWTILLISSAGVPLSTFPKVLGTFAAGTTGGRLLKLSTGTVFIFSGALSTYSYNYSFISLAGAFSVSSALLYGIAPGSGQTFATLILNDTVFGVVTGGTSTIADAAIFSIANDGSINSSPCYFGFSVGVTANASLRINYDASQQQLYVIGMGASGQTAIAT